MTKQSYEKWAASALARPVARSGELAAMREGMGELLSILSWARPHGSDAELEFLRVHVLQPLRDAGFRPDIDDFGNVWARVDRPQGSKGPDVLWSCHVDTVHAKGGRQAVIFGEDGRTVQLAKRKPGRCLGADDGAGVWLLLQMIRAGIPGGYVFHRGEEVGRLGSEHVADNEPNRLVGYDACVAFDRRDYSDLITHQMGRRCASELFASTFGAAINGAAGGKLGLAYRADDTGSYTDSYSYASLVSECCNLSVGYDSEHGPRETLDALHLWRLSQAMCAIDLGGVVCERDPSADDWGYTFGYPSMTWGNGTGSRTGAAAWGYDPDDSEEALLDLVRRYPGAVAKLLDTYGLGADDVLEMLDERELGAALSIGSRSD